MPVIGNLKGGKVIAIDNLCLLLAIKKGEGHCDRQLRWQTDNLCLLLAI
jgi:hypothetical protein